MRVELQPSGGWLNPEAMRSAPITIVHVWALSCSLCKAQMATVRRWLTDERVRVISVHTPIRPEEADREQIARMADGIGLTAPIALDDDGGIADALEVRSLPAYFVYDADALRFIAAGAGADRRVEDTLRDFAS